MSQLLFLLILEVELAGTIMALLRGRAMKEMKGVELGMGT